jgi:outer membrane protein
MKKIGMLVSVFLLTTGIQVSQAADVQTSNAQVTASTPLKVAVVNVQDVLRKSPRVSVLSKKLEGEFKGRQTKIGDEQKTLQDALDKLKKESPTMSQKERDATQKKLAAQRADLVKQVVAYQQDLQKEQNKVMEGILADLNGIVTDIAKKQNYSLVLDSQAVIYAVGGNDITEDVAKRFNDEKTKS